MAADQFADYYYVDVKGRAVIDGKDVPVSTIEVNYALDTIPSCELDVPIGRKVNANAIGSVSPSEGLITSLDPFTSVEVFLTLTAPAGRSAPPGKDPGFPTNEFKIFEGFVSGMGTSKRAQGAVASLKVRAFGRVIGLAGSSQMTTGLVEPTQDDGGATPIVCKLGNDQEGAARATILETLIDLAPDVVGDVWTDGIAVLFEAMVEMPDAWATANRTENDANDFAASALSRINLSEESTLPVLPLVLSADQVIEDLLLRSALRTMVNILYMNWAGATAKSNLWEALLALGQQFLFHFVPAVEDEVIAPITFALGGDAWRVIDPNEYYLIDESTNLNDRFYSYISSVGLFASEGGFQQSPSSPADFVAKPLGYATVELPNKAKGQFLLLPAPAWLIPPGASSEDSTNFDTTDGFPDAANPGKTTGQDGQAQPSLASAFLNSDLGETVADSILHDNLFAHRMMQIGGRLRFDIAPGSLIQLNTVGEKFTGERDTLFGHVLEVSIKIGEVDGGESYARTEFVIGHVRSQEEHDSLTVEAHPLYKQTWVGGQLVKY